ncbi:MAG: hypothetical protein ACHQCE_14985 [Streptosporangiales bacterium]
MTTSSGTSIHAQVRLTGGLPVRFARRGAPGPGEPVPSPASTAPAGRTARTRLTVDDAWCEALSASAPQRSAAPAAESVAAAISRAVRRLGTRGCVSRMAQESGDHPQAAAERMRWVRQLAAGTAAPGDLRARARGRLADPRGSPPARRSAMSSGRGCRPAPGRSWPRS